MSDHLSADAYFGNLPPSERLALDLEASWMISPPPVSFLPDNRTAADPATRQADNDISA